MTEITTGRGCGKERGFASVRSDDHDSADRAVIQNDQCGRPQL